MRWRRFVICCLTCLSRGNGELSRAAHRAFVARPGRRDRLWLGRCSLFLASAKKLESPSPPGMDRLRRGLAWLVRFPLDRAPFADRLDRVLRISRPRRGLDCRDRARCEVHFTRRCHQTPSVDASQLRAYSRGHHSADVLSSYFPVPLAFFDGLPAIAWLCWIPNAIAAEAVPAFRANTCPDSAGQPHREFPTTFVSQKVVCCPIAVTQL